MKNHLIKELCELISIQINPAAHANKIYLGLEHIATSRFLRIGGGRAADVQSSKFTFQKGDILYSKLRPYLDKAVLADCEGVCTTELLVLRPHSDIDPRFLLCVLHSPDFIQHALSGVTGAQHPRTSWHRISEFEISDSIIKNQTTISAILWQVQNAIMASDKIIQKTEELKNAITQELFTKGLQGAEQSETEFGLLPANWPLIKIGDVISLSQYGLSLRGQPNGQYPILRMNCQDNGKVLYRDLQYVNLDPKTFTTFQLNSGDILFNRTNSLELVGRSAIVIQDIKAVFASYLIRIRANNSIIESRFLNYFLNWNVTQSELKKLASRGVSQANISASKLKDFSIPIPTLDEQQQIITILDAIDQKIDLHKSKRTFLSELFKTLLHKLMRGEIQVSELDLSVLETSVDAIGTSV